MKPSFYSFAEYSVAAVFGLLGGAFGVIVSPLVLFSLRHNESENADKADAWLLWILIGVIAAPLTSQISQDVLGDWSVPRLSDTPLFELHIDVNKEVN